MTHRTLYLHHSLWWVIRDPIKYGRIVRELMLCPGHACTCAKLHTDIPASQHCESFIYRVNVPALQYHMCFLYRVYTVLRCRYAHPIEGMRCCNAGTCIFIHPIKDLLYSSAGIWDDAMQVYFTLYRGYAVLSCGYINNNPIKMFYIVVQVY